MPRRALGAGVEEKGGRAVQGPEQGGDVVSTVLQEDSI